MDQPYKKELQERVSEDDTIIIDSIRKIHTYILSIRILPKKKTKGKRKRQSC